MQTLWVALGVAGWAACSFLAYGRTFAHFQRKYPRIAAEGRRGDMAFAAFMAVGGPVGLFVALLMGRRGFMWRVPHVD